jgi:hypothetical protein
LSSWSAVPPAPPACLDRHDADPDLSPDDADRQRRLDWARLLKRSYHVDALVCPRCDGPMRLIALIEDQPTARRILEHLALPSPKTRAPPPPDHSAAFDGIDPIPTDEA